LNDLLQAAEDEEQVHLERGGGDILHLNFNQSPQEEIPTVLLGPAGQQDEHGGLIF
jgi:hypothetical protein